MDFDQVPVMWTEVAGRVSRANVAAAEAMAEEMQKLARRLVSHPGRGAPGAPPGLQSGNLRENIRIIPAAGDAEIATASVGSFAVYARVQEEGATLWPSSHRFLHWVDDRGSMYLPFVVVRKHPYMSTAREIGINTGVFSRVAARSFLARIGIGR